MPLTLSERAKAIRPSVTLSIDAQAKKMRASGLDVIPFGAGEPDFPTPAYICEAAKSAVDAGIARYTAANGTPELREAICKKFRRDNAVDYSPDEIIVSCGAKQSLFTALSVLLNPGDEVLLPAPCWLSYPEMVRMAGGVPVMVAGSETTGFTVSAQMLRPHITSRTKALIINSPANPTGSVYRRSELEKLGELAVECGFYILSDEIYEKLVYDGAKHHCMAALSDAVRAQTIVVNGVSKSYAMTGWRIGYAAGPQAVIRAMSAFQSHASGAPNSIAQRAAAAALAGGDRQVFPMVAEYGARRRLMHRLLNETGIFSCRLPEGAFYLLLDLQKIIGMRCRGEAIDGSVRFAELLLQEKHVAVVPALAFGNDRFARLSYAVARSDIEEGCRRIAEFAFELQN